MGLLISEFVMERKIRNYFRDFCEDMQYFESIWQVFLSPICLVYYVCQVMVFCCLFFVDQELSNEFITMAKKNCGLDVYPLESRDMTFGVDLYSTTLLGGLLGMYVTRHDQHLQAQGYSFYDFLRCVKRAAPGLLLLFAIVPSWR